MPADLSALMKQFLAVKESPFITCEVTGGLGNQLFQMATAMAVAMECGLEFRPIRSSSAYTYGGSRPVYWDTVFKEFPTCDASALLTAASWKEQSFRYQPIPRFTASTRLVGYFQSYRYFDLVQHRILPKFAFPKESELQHFLQQAKDSFTSTTSTSTTTTTTTTTATSSTTTSRNVTAVSTAKAPSGSSGNSGASTVVVVSVHVRSYVEPDGSQAPASIHCRLDADYYQKALDLICSLCGEQQRVAFLVFSDDVRYARELLRALPSQQQLVFLQDLDDWKTLGDAGELKLMSMCDHHILANSTFSWWAAYLATAATGDNTATRREAAEGGTAVAAIGGSATGTAATGGGTATGGAAGAVARGKRTVVAPRRWFGPDGPSAEDLTPPDWTLL